MMEDFNHSSSALRQTVTKSSHPYSEDIPLVAPNLIDIQKTVGRPQFQQTPYGFSFNFPFSQHRWDSKHAAAVRFPIRIDHLPGC